MLPDSNAAPKKKKRANPPVKPTHPASKFCSNTTMPGSTSTAKSAEAEEVRFLAYNRTFVAETGRGFLGQIERLQTRNRALRQGK